MLFLQYLILLLLVVGSIFSQNGRRLVFTNFTYSADPKYWNFTVWLNESRVSGIVMAVEKTINVTTDLKLFVNTGSPKGEYVNFFTKHVDFCQVLAYPISDPFVNMIYQTLTVNKNNRLFRKCPIVKVSDSRHNLFP